MEIIIILLIAVEVTIVLIREGHELANLLYSYIIPDYDGGETFREATKHDGLSSRTAEPKPNTRVEEVVEGRLV
jgi:hypothetical protein